MQINQPTTINTPNDLAQRLAHIARSLTTVITTTLTTPTTQTTNTPAGIVHRQFEHVQQTLLPTITPAVFADMYAQTLVYGMFAVRVATPHTPTFTRADVPDAMPHTLPWLPELCSLPAAQDDPLLLLLDDCAHILAQTNMAVVLQDFGKTTMQADPMIHFYETFLAAYDPKTRDMRGVYYTPAPVVSFMVRFVDHLLQSQFDKPLGLAADDTLVLDPATGTGMFLHAVVQHMYATLVNVGMGAMWQQYVPAHLLPRLFGYELLMAPYTIAHMKMRLLIHQYGYPLGKHESLAISLTNTLSDSPTGKHKLPIAQQRTAPTSPTNPIMVVLGNPPYAYESVNNGEWIGALVRDYYTIDGKPLGERNPKGLQDDYVKFLRFGQWHITQAGAGILAFITNHGYLDNPTFRGMRQRLLHDFTTIYIYNLHGNRRKKEQTPDGTPDDNVFAIQQGVAIGIFVRHDTLDKEHTTTTQATVYYADMWGKREEKYARLLAEEVDSIAWQQLTPTSPWYLFVPQDTQRRLAYEQGEKITDLLPVNSVGIVTSRDHLTIQWTPQTMLHVVHHFVALSEAAARQHYHLGDDVRDWKVATAQANIRTYGIDDKHVVPILYRPFDVRYTYYTGDDKGFLCRPRSRVMRHMLAQPNLGLVTVRQVAEGLFTHAFVTEHIIDSRVTLSNKGISFLFPLYLTAPSNQSPMLQFAQLPEPSCHPNFSPTFIAAIEHQLGMAFVPVGSGDGTTTFGSEALLHYIYAVLSSPKYRSCYAEFLKIDFPHIPLPNDKTLFTQLATYGAMLVDLHLLRVPGSMGVGGAGGATILLYPADQGVTQHDVTHGTVDLVKYVAQDQRVIIGDGRSFAGIDAATWAMQVGGYHPLHKWLKDRRGRTLSSADALHYMQMVIALRETLRLMAAIDAIIPLVG